MVDSKLSSEEATAAVQEGAAAAAAGAYTRPLSSST